MTPQLDTITTQLGNIQQAVHTMPTWTALEGTLAPINAAIRDLSHRVAALPPQPPAPTQPQVPPAGVTTRQAPAQTRPPFPPTGTTTHPPPRPKARPLPPSKGSSSAFDPDIPRYDVDTQSFYGNPRAYADKFPHSWEANTFREGKYPDPTTFISAHLAPDCPKPQQRYAKVALNGARRAKRIRVPSQPPKSRQLATVGLPSSQQSRSPRPKEDSTLHVLPPPSTNKRP